MQIHPKIIFTDFQSFSHSVTIQSFLYYRDISLILSRNLLLISWISKNCKKSKSYWPQKFLALRYFFNCVFPLASHNIILPTINSTGIYIVYMACDEKSATMHFPQNKINDTPKIRIIITKLFPYCPMAVGQWSVYSIVMLNSGFCSNSCDGNKHNKN